MPTKSPKEKLWAVRSEIDVIDKQLIDLLEQRMLCSDEIADIKLLGNIAIMDETREEQVLAQAKENINDSFASDSQTFMRNLMSLSRLRQAKKILPQQVLSFPPSNANAPRGNATLGNSAGGECEAGSQGALTSECRVGYQGVVGAWGHAAAKELFHVEQGGAELERYDYFEDVFAAVHSGELDYGVLPIENSQSGAIGEVYDLLRRYGLYVVAQRWLEIKQCLLGNKGAQLSDVREIYSHPEGFKQCFNYLKGKNFELTSCRNTAYAAQKVAASKASDGGSDKAKAAIASRNAAEEYGLVVLAPDIMDNKNNRTRFIVIAKEPEYSVESDIISVSFATAHKSGALSAVIECFALAGLNLTRIESRPAGQGEYRFFVDLVGNILNSETMSALQNAAGHCEYFEILGCYS